MLLWLTDSHLNFLRPNGGVEYFAQYLVKENPEATGLVITGDISSGIVLEQHLRTLCSTWTKPIYMVLGNHDFYDASFKSIHEMMSNLTKEIPHLHWLNAGNQVHEGLLITGVGGWFDAYNGNPYSSVALNDFFLISELREGLDEHSHLLQIIRSQAIQESKVLDKNLEECKDYETIFVCTHIPPYADASWHNGAPSDNEWVPWFSSGVLGNVLDKYSEMYPEKKFIVLTGHSHSPGVYQRSENLVVYTGRAVYGNPSLSGKIDVQNRKIYAMDQTFKNIERNF